MPVWAFGSTLMMLAIGAFIMQMGVQGAWGNIPVHLNELSPDAVRGLLPGFTYQIGILLAASTPTVEFALRDRLGYAWALTAFELVVMAVPVAAAGVWQGEAGAKLCARNGSGCGVDSGADGIEPATSWEADTTAANCLT